MRVGVLSTILNFSGNETNLVFPGVFSAFISSGLKFLFQLNCVLLIKSRADLA